MSKEIAMKNVLQNYIDAFNRNDLSGIVALYAEDASVEDPYGSEPRVGKEQIRTFYQNALSSGAKLELAVPVRATMSNAAAMAFVAVIHSAQGLTRIHVIDVMTFNEQGLIISMRAYFGQSDIQSAQA